jgi:hypothetical protein
MFFRRKSVTLASLDERLSVVEIALQIRSEEAPLGLVSRPSTLEQALANLHRAITRDQAARN